MIVHLLPELPAGLAKSVQPPRGKRKLQPIPSMGHHGRVTIPDEVVAGIKWCQEHGLTWQQSRGMFPGLPEKYFQDLQQGIVRSYILPRCPPFISEHFWKERYRWPK